MARGKSQTVDTPKAADASQKLQAIKMAMEQIDKQYGRGSIMRLGEKTAASADLEVIPTGSIALDLALGVGGIPRGRVIEIFGPEASGKTTLSLHIISEVQKMGGTAAFVDAEHALDPARAEAIGVNVDDLLISQPDTGEQALEIVETLVRSGAVDVIVVDSVAALVPRAEIEGEMGDSVMGVQARLMSQALRKLTGAINKTHTTVIFTNQLRLKIGVMFGNPETTPGGLALKFYASIRIDIRKIEALKEGDLVVGSRHRARIVKNKVAPPFRVAEFDIMNDFGISKVGGVVDVGVELGVINKSGAFYRYDGEILGQGKVATISALEEDPKKLKELEVKVRAAAASGKKLPKELGENTDSDGEE
jgi:recombination protein RecA